MADEKRVDEPTGTEFVGHEWDGIEELDTPMPRWWLWTFYATIAFSIVYVVLYPAWPLVDKATDGMLGWSSRGQLAEDMARADAAQADFRQQLVSTPLAELRANEDLMARAVSGGAAAFKVHCVQCHGSGAAGDQELGYPNLNDDAWLWGGDLEAIEYALNHGIRWQDDPQTRQSQMPGFDGILDENQLNAVVTHVLSLSGQGQSNATAAQLYQQNCAACHGSAGEGGRQFGAPRLNDAIWLRGGSPEQIRQQILYPKMGVMPEWDTRLDPATIRMLAAYVHSLGGGEAMPAPVIAAAPTQSDPTEEGDEQP